MTVCHFLRTTFLVALATPIVACLAVVGRAEEKAAAQKTNRLARESSPYLLHHAHNPVDWYPWGEEAFARAKKEGKLVFLSSGYNSCHWCHVMERESFMNDEVAKVLNEHFVCIKLDREERPEVDHLYLTALNAMGNNGGWPLSMFLMADGKPIAGGTYWPRDDREVQGQTVPGFKSILKAVIDVQKNDPETLQKTADLRAEQTRRLLAVSITPQAEVPLSRDLVAAAVQHIEESFDPQYGGFGIPPGFRGPKFPRPPLLSLLQSQATRTKSQATAEKLQFTLEKVARSGTYDQIGGGFHRYSTERTWTVPHFEKMLYDNAQLLDVTARVYQQTRGPLEKRILKETLAFVAREMTSPEGAFYTSLDADSATPEGSLEEGRFYVWKPEELDAVIKDPKDREFLKATYGMDGTPNFENETFIPVYPTDVDDKDQPRLERLKQQLLEARSQRPRPSLDTKILTSWNGQMIAGMARAGHVLGDAQSVQRAVKAADFLVKTMKYAEGEVPNRLYHVYAAVPGEPAKARLAGCLDDYAHLIHGLLTLHDVTQDDRWLKEAQALAETVQALFHDKAGGYFVTAADHPLLFTRIRDQYDGVQPCGNSQTASNLVRLWQKTGEEKYRQLAEETFKTFAPTLKDDPRGLTTLAEALGDYLDLAEAKKAK